VDASTGARVPLGAGGTTTPATGPYAEAKGPLIREILPRAYQGSTSEARDAGSQASK
jgi:hypothetical protein